MRKIAALRGGGGGLATTTTPTMRGGGDSCDTPSYGTFFPTSGTTYTSGIPHTDLGEGTFPSGNCPLNAATQIAGLLNVPAQQYTIQNYGQADQIVAPPGSSFSLGGGLKKKKKKTATGAKKKVACPASCMTAAGKKKKKNANAAGKKKKKAGAGSSTTSSSGWTKTTYRIRYRDSEGKLVTKVLYYSHATGAYRIRKMFKKGRTTTARFVKPPKSSEFAP